MAFPTEAIAAIKEAITKLAAQTVKSFELTIDGTTRSYTAADIPTLLNALKRLEAIEARLAATDGKTNKIKFNLG